MAEPQERKPMSDSVTSDTEVGAETFEQIHPTEGLNLTDKALLFFNDIISEKAKADWSQHQITYAAMLARFMAELDTNQEKLAEEGSLVKTKADGRIRENPRIKIITMMFDKINATRRSLGIHALVGNNWIGRVKPRTNKRRIKEMEIEAAIDDAIDDEGLLA